MSQIRFEFLPPNTTSVLQLCDQGIIELTERGFKNRLLDFIMEQMDEDSESTAPQLVRKVTLLNAILWLDEAWKDLPATTITKCWRRGGLVASSAPDIEMEEETEVRPNILYLTEEEFNEWIRADDEIQATQESTDEEISQNVHFNHYSINHTPKLLVLFVG